MNFEKIKKKVCKIVPDRYAHSIGVAETCAALAKRWGEDSKKACLAGLIHDVAKNVCLKDLEKLGIKQSIKLKKIHENFPQIWHATIAPDYIKCIFGIEDKKILNAIKWHCTGKSRMNNFEKILYVSDYIEPGRKYEGVSYIRELANFNLNQAVYALSTSAIFYVLKKGCAIFPATIKCRNYYLKLLKKDIADEINKRLGV